MNQLVLTTIDDRVATITLNRPKRHNSLVPSLLEELATAIASIRGTSGVGAVILQANGRSFSTGGDMKGFLDNINNLEAYASQLVGLLNQLIMDLVLLPLPVMAAVHGTVNGGSIGLVLACDLVLVTRAASFTPYYSEVGFSPDGGWTAMLPDFIGTKRATSVLLENQTISASQAVAWGLADREIPAGSLREEALSCGRYLAERKQGAIRTTKQLLTRSGLANRLEEERSLFIKQIATAEAREGILSFNTQAK
jgi:2-(1,2-epoxy-1,2-dihydrophenyl)acetyl-CoA isomerase